MAGRRIRSVCLLLAIGLLVPATARASDDHAERHGSCSGGPGSWELVVHQVTSTTMRIRFSIEDADPGERWQLFFSVDGKRIRSLTRRTDGGGDVHARKLTADSPGRDRIKAFGVNIDSGGSCEGSATH